LVEAARADYLVTGDQLAGLLLRKPLGAARILIAPAFCREVVQERR